MPTVEITIPTSAAPLLREAARRLRGRSDATVDRLLSSSSDASDPVRAALYGAIESAPRVRAKLGRYATKAMKEALEDVPAFLRAEDYADIDALDARAIVESLLEWPEFADVRSFPFALTFRKTAGNSAGAVVLGTCRALGARERLTWRGRGPAPFWEITLALDLWLLATPYERRRLIHHEMMHAAVEVTETDDESGEPTEARPGIRAHPVEEFPTTAARFGAVHPEHIRLADAITAHPDLADLRLELAAPPGEQLSLFPATSRSTP